MGLITLKPFFYGRIFCLMFCDGTDNSTTIFLRKDILSNVCDRTHNTTTIIYGRIFCLMFCDGTHNTTTTFLRKDILSNVLVL